MNEKGFTLVELLAVIIIMSLLMAIAIPSSITIGNRIKQKTLNEKYSLAEKAAVLWATNNHQCFTPSKSCTVLDYIEENEEKMMVRITLGELAESGFFDYDDKTKKTIENPVDKSDLSKSKIRIVYNLKTKNASSGLVDVDSTYTLTFNGNGSTSGVMPGITCNYDAPCKISTNKFIKTGYEFAGWSEKAAGTVNYADASDITITYDKTLYAVWNELDLTSPVITFTPTKSFEPGASIYATSVSIKISATDNSSGVKTIKYCSSTNASCTPNTTITNNSNVTLSGRTGSILDNTICVIATDNAGNNSEVKCETYKVDRENPKITCSDNGNWSNTTSTINCTATDNAGVRKLDWSKDGNTWTTFSSINPSGPFAPSYTSSFSTDTYINKVRVTDEPGLTYTNNYVYSKIDKVPPLAMNIDIAYSLSDSNNNISSVNCTNNEYLADGTLNPSYNKYANNICTVYTARNASWQIFWYWPDDWGTDSGYSGVSHLTYSGSCSSSYYTGGTLSCMYARSGNTITFYTYDNAGNKSLYYFRLTIS